MAGIRGISTIEPIYYGSGAEILSEFLLPVLSESIGYDRITSYFTIDALLAVSQGLDSLYVNNGNMRLVVGIHDFPKEAALAVAEADSFELRVQDIRKNLTEGIAKLSDSLLKDRLATVALMIEDGFLSVKVIDTSSDSGIFHSKLLIMRDAEGDSVAAMGSFNETASGLGDNHENLMVLRSWIDGDGISKQQDIFEKTWAGKFPNLIIQDLTHELAQDIIDGIGEEHIQRVRLRLKLQADLRDTLGMPSFLFVSGIVPALYQHQERAVLDALSRWPIRVLFADEVGLGKTFEVATTIAYLIRFCGVKRTVILTPKSVLTQWQEELHDSFGINAWRYESGRKEFVDCDGATRPIRDNCPLGKGMPSIALISAQYARGTSAQDDIFSRPGAILPDVLAIDEAHAARVSIDLGGQKKRTRLYRALRQVASKIPHLILATATPMQRDSVEYHSLLNLLGLPEHWAREKAFQLSLSIIASSEAPSVSDLSSAATLLLEVMNSMKPNLDALEPKEKTLLDELASTNSSLARGTIAFNEWECFKKLFIKLHPARLLTIRNTRRSLEDVGYVFPERKLKAETLFGREGILRYYKEVNAYIGSTYLGVEKALYPDRRFSDGFVKSSYQQRMASSLYSCGESLNRRFAKLTALKALVTQGDISQWSITTDLSEEDEDDALLTDKEIDEVETAIAKVDKAQVLLALNAELANLTPLISRLETVREKNGDPKIDRSIDIALEHLSRGNQVLVFSRYTDTVDALLLRWRQIASNDITYGVYTGAGAVLVQSGTSRKTTKDEIKNLLNSGTLKIMFCSDAASEGLNLQAARILINVDVPWTPARLEQRIGRIARLGQKAMCVEIINVWYPNSVEERMYSRINQRLQGYNLVVGEFPEVVADSIRRSIIEPGYDDKSLQLLQDIRNSLQTSALYALWDQESASKTASRTFREKLIADIKDNAEYDEVGGSSIAVTLRNGSSEIVTPDEGNKETVSLSSKCVLELFPRVKGFRTAKDEDGRNCAFANGREILNPEMLPTLLGGVTDYSSLCSGQEPRWLPSVAGVSLAYAFEGDTSAPKCWPPMLGEQA